MAYLEAKALVYVEAKPWLTGSEASAYLEAKALVYLKAKALAYLEAKARTRPPFGMTSRNGNAKWVVCVANGGVCMANGGGREADFSTALLTEA